MTVLYSFDEKIISALKEQNAHTLLVGIKKETLQWLLLKETGEITMSAGPIKMHHFQYNDAL